VVSKKLAERPGCGGRANPLLTTDFSSFIISVYSDFSDFTHYSRNNKELNMAKDKNTACDCSAGNCCKVDDIVSVDERGQMVLPKDLRDKAGIRAGDKLAVVSMNDKEGKTCCLSLIKVESLTNMVKDMLGPVMDEVFKK
jgi:AbrB family looped-hinge helix DNA binding protein